MTIEKSRFLFPVFLVLMVLVVTGCSATKDYEKTVGELKSALATSVETISKIDKKATAEKNKKLMDNIVKGIYTLAPEPGACAGKATNCTLVVYEPGAAQSIVAPNFPIKSVTINAQRAFVALGEYLHTLHEIAKVDTAGKVAEETNKALVSVSQIEADLARINKTKNNELIKSYSEPAGALFNWAVEAYVQNVKHDALATATREAQPAIDGLNDLFAGISEASAQKAKSEADARYIKASDAYTALEDNETITPAAINALVKESAANDEMRKAVNAQPFAAFAEAHRKLKQFLNNEGDISLADAVASIKLVKKKAEEFKALIENFKPQES